MPTLARVRGRVPRPAPWLIDTAVALALAVATAVDLATRTLEPGQHPTDAVGYVLVVAMAGPFVLHRRWPLVAVATVLSALVVYSLVPYSAFPGLNAFVLLFAVALHCDRRRSLVALAATLVALTVAVAVQPAGIVDRSTWVSTELATAVAWLGGVNLRQRRARTTALRERAELLERERGEQARQAVVEERLRIARELHDVVAHSMSVIAVQSGVGHHVIDSQPEEARRALAAIEETSRAALVEMRRMLGVLRAEGEDYQILAPAPGLADVPALVGQVHAAGVSVDVRVEGEAPVVPPGVDLSAYRIVQEALTNVIRHGGPSARVSIRYAEDQLRLEVVDDGRPEVDGGSWGQPPVTGHGLVGMRERVAACGGDLSVGARPGGGFRVAAVLPLGETQP